MPLMKTHKFPINSAGIVFEPEGVRVLVPTAEIPVFEQWVSEGLPGKDDPEEFRAFYERHPAMSQPFFSMLLSLISLSVAQGVDLSFLKAMLPQLASGDPR